ncbi:MAG: hypothetical protein JOZ17_03145 [Acetobacteraceae bacterium]|nr:hypothetical protein [Acetobacteraceae bacterium]MBV8616748.1 hypothetical protein [Acetobacteraceae bacterium]
MSGGVEDISRSLAVSDRFYCLLEGRVALSGRPSQTGREQIMRHYFQGRRPMIAGFAN